MRVLRIALTIAALPVLGCVADAVETSSAAISVDECYAACDEQMYYCDSFWWGNYYPCSQDCEFDPGFGEPGFDECLAQCSSNADRDVWLCYVDNVWPCVEACAPPEPEPEPECPPSAYEMQMPNDCAGPSW